MTSRRDMIAKKLKDYRENHNLNQFEFAEECGISRETLSLGGHAGSPLLLKIEKGYALLGLLSQSLMENPISIANIAMYVDAYRLLDLV